MAAQQEEKGGGAAGGARRKPGGALEANTTCQTLEAHLGGASPASSDLLTLRLRVVLAVSTRLMASAWLRSAQARLPMATSWSNSLSPPLQALLRLRTCRDKRDIDHLVSEHGSSG